MNVETLDEFMALPPSDNVDNLLQFEKLIVSERHSHPNVHPKITHDVMMYENLVHDILVNLFSFATEIRCRSGTE